jgi:uncharacterized protein YjbI with pentapeptide repeats
VSNPEHLRILKLGTPEWNRWRAENPNTAPDLGGAHLREVSLSRANLSRADLRLAYFGRADLSGADLSGADVAQASLRRAYLAGAVLDAANLVETDLSHASLAGARLRGVNLSRAYLEGADLSGADLERAKAAGADLTRAIAVKTSFREADLSGCRVYGISAWSLTLDGAVQQDLVITPAGENVITADRLDVAQFLYLLLNNRNIRDVVETVGKRAVLILGRFTEPRKAVLDSVRDRVRVCGLIPILFDFEGPSNRDVTETVSTLAHLARVIIADLTDARSVPQELMAIVPHLPSVPLQPILAKQSAEYGMFEHFRRYPWVHEVFRYDSPLDLVDWLPDRLRALASLPAP